MIQKLFGRNLRSAALGGAALAALLPAAAQAQDSATADMTRPVESIDEDGITIRNNLGISTPAPGGAFDNAVNVTGVGQMIIPYEVAPGSFSLGLCTGTLINPRAVIFAAHCVNSDPAESYGNTTGGQSIAFAFNAFNNDRSTATSSAVRAYLGFNPGSTFGATDTDMNLYNVEQVWWDPRSMEATINNPPAGFIQADVAIATLDTPAFDIPTWAMLFTPLTSPTHATINGYGANGNGTTGSGGIDYRRRIAENMIDFLGSLNDRNIPLYGSGGLPSDAAVYQMDFDSPAGQGVGFDFDLFDGAALPNEGITAGGDSGGPLIVDQKFAIDVIAGVLSGGSRFYGNQPSAAYGTSSFYQPLHLYWDVIVANNPYVYAGTRGGDKNWSDASAWVQLMDPNYMIEGANGQLVNALPGTAAGGITDGGTRFGKVCFLNECVDIAPFYPQGNGRGTGRDGRGGSSIPVPNSIYIPGGPGTLNFTPDNVRANPGQGVKARYYDVNINTYGTITVDGDYTVDKLTMSQRNAGLTLANGSYLEVLGDYTQTNGTLLFRGGVLETGEALLYRGSLMGEGLFVAPYITTMNVDIMPGDTAIVPPELRPNGTPTLGNDRIGTLNIFGNLVMTSATTTWINIGRNNSDLINVDGLGGNIPVGGSAEVSAAAIGANPYDGAVSVGGTLRIKANPNFTWGQTHTIITADGGVTNQFDRVLGGSNVISVNVGYNPNNVTVTLNAANLATVAAAPTETAVAFGNALDSLRYTNYADLYEVYNMVDYLDPRGIALALDGMAPRIVNEAAMLDREQGRTTMELVGDRLSLLGTRAANMGRLTIVGSPEAVFQMPGQTQMSGSSVAQMSFASTLASEQRLGMALPQNVSGFLAGGYTSQPGTADSQRQGWHMAMGLEMEAAPETTLGTAFAYSSGSTRLGGSAADADTAQAMAYGAYQLGGGAYLGGMASMSHTRIGVQRSAMGVDMGQLRGQATAASYALRAEAGVNLTPVAGVTLTPRASLSYEGSNLSGYREAGSVLGLMVDDLNDQRLVGRFGAKLSGSVGKAGGWKLAPEARVDWVQTLAGGATSYDVRFAAAPELAFALPLASQDKSWGEIKGGLRLTKDRMAIAAGVESSIGRENYRDDRAVASFTIGF